MNTSKNPDLQSISTMTERECAEHLAERLKSGTITKADATDVRTLLERANSADDYVADVFLDAAAAILITSR